MARSAVNTRIYDYDNGERLAVAVASAATTAGKQYLELLLHASVKCYVNIGAAPVAIATGASIPIEAGEKFHVSIHEGDKVAVIRDSTDGYLHIIGVL